jgi:phosphatidylinositol alpha-1,6-mannosyltransferase
MDACDVFAMPNREIDGDNEGFGMVFIEAAACTKPVLTGWAGETGAAMVDGVTGVRVDGNDVETIASTLQRLLTDQALCWASCEAGLKRARAEFA